MVPQLTPVPLSTTIRLHYGALPNVPVLLVKLVSGVSGVCACVHVFKCMCVFVCVCACICLPVYGLCGEVSPWWSGDHLNFA